MYTKTYVFTILNKDFKVKIFNNSKSQRTDIKKDGDGLRDREREREREREKY